MGIRRDFEFKQKQIKTSKTKNSKKLYKFKGNLSKVL